MVTARQLTAPVVALLVLGVTMTVALGIGAVHVPVPDVLEVIARRLRLADPDVPLVDDQIVWQMRMPRVLGAAAVGAGLAVCGTVLQSLTRNDLADPYLLGISSGAAVGAVTVIVLGTGIGGLVGGAAVGAAAFLGALAALVLVLVLAAGPGGSLPPSRTVLAGVAVGQACAAYTSFLVMSQGDSQAARRMLDWTLGSVAGLRWQSSLGLTAVVLVATLVILGNARSLDAFAFGEASARSLGVDVTRLRWLLLAGSALLTAVLVANVGAIGFVGLVVPHMVRLVTGPTHRVLLPMAALVGATFLVAADTAARSVAGDTEIPIGVVTGLVGAPFFAWLLRRARSGRAGVAG